MNRLEAIRARLDKATLVQSPWPALNELLLGPIEDYRALLRVADAAEAFRLSMTGRNMQRLHDALIELLYEVPE